MNEKTQLSIITQPRRKKKRRVEGGEETKKQEERNGEMRTKWRERGGVEVGDEGWSSRGRSLWKSRRIGSGGLASDPVIGCEPRECLPLTGTLLCSFLFRCSAGTHQGRLRT